MIDKPWLSSYDENVRFSLSYPNIALHELFIDRADRFSDKICLQFGETRYTYAETKEIVLRVARGLIRFGLIPGNRVGLVLPNIPQFVFAYYGILAAGGAAVPLNPVYTIHELEGQVKNTEIRFLIGLEEQAELLQTIAQDLSLDRLFLINKHEVVPSEIQTGIKQTAHQQKFARTLRFNDLIENQTSRLELPQISADAAAVFQFSGGTTGSPKAAVALHRNLVANTLQFREWLNSLQDGQEQFLTAIPFSHVYGMVIGLNVGVAMGATIHLLPDPRNIKSILQTIETKNISFYPGVPTMYHAINQDADVRAGCYDLRSIKACISGSAPLSPQIRQEFERLTGGKLVEGYGLSEAPTATHCNPILGENRNGSIGLPLPNVECQILKIEKDQEGVGELLVRGPQVMSHYHNQEDETKNAIVDGWLKTGDIARMDKDGYFYLVGRNKDLIKVGGLQVWPREVEEVITRLPSVREAVVAGIPDLAKGELVKAWIVMREGQTLDAQSIKEYCRGEIAYFKVPVEIAFINEIPRSPVGKVLRRELVKRDLEDKQTSGVS